MHTVRKTLALVATAVLVTLGLLAVPATALGAAGSVVDDRCPTSASACHYRLPSSITSARNTCYRAEADQRGIPHAEGAYVAWWNSTTAARRADWTRAFQRCQDRNQLPGGKWAWGQMVYVGSD